MRRQKKVNFKWVGRYNRRCQKYGEPKILRLFRITGYRRTFDGKRWYDWNFSVGLQPRLWFWSYSNCPNWYLIVCGVRFHYKRSWSESVNYSPAEIMRRALHFYADPNHWMGFREDGPAQVFVAHGRRLVEGDGWEVAEDALRRVGEDSPVPEAPQP